MNLQVSEIRIHRTVKKSIRRHAQEMAAMNGSEAVGFIAAPVDEDMVTATVRLHNHAFNPNEAFFVEPHEQFRAEQKLLQAGYKIVGVYHSHVRAEALPSQADHTMARPQEYVLIYSVAFDELKAYKEHDGILEPVEMI